MMSSAYDLSFKRSIAAGSNGKNTETGLRTDSGLICGLNLLGKPSVFCGCFCHPYKDMSKFIK